MPRFLPALLVLAAANTAPAQAPDDPTELPPIDVTRERSPLDSQRPLFERSTPCLGCDAAPSGDDFLVTVLGLEIVPGEPAAGRPTDWEVQPPLARFQDKHLP